MKQLRIMLLVLATIFIVYGIYNRNNNHKKNNKESIIADTMTYNSNGFILPQGEIFKYVAYYCDSFGVPREFIYDMGMNESGWRNPDNLEYIQGPDFVPGESSYGDLQMITPTWNYWSKKLGLKEKNRKNLLIACIAYSKSCYLLGDSSWEKARYIYARGKWKPKSKWTRLEKKFMSKMNFNKY